MQVEIDAVEGQAGRDTVEYPGGQGLERVVLHAVRRLGACPENGSQHGPATHGVYETANGNVGSREGLQNGFRPLSIPATRPPGQSPIVLRRWARSSSFRAGSLRWQCVDFARWPRRFRRLPIASALSIRVAELVTTILSAGQPRCVVCTPAECVAAGKVPDGRTVSRMPFDESSESRRRRSRPGDIGPLQATGLPPGCLRGAGLRRLGAERSAHRPRQRIAAPARADRSLRKARAARNGAVDRAPSNTRPIGRGARGTRCRRPKRGQSAQDQAAVEFMGAFADWPLSDLGNRPQANPHAYGRSITMLP